MTSPAAATLAARAGFVSRLAAFLVDAALVTLALRVAGWILSIGQHALRGFWRPFNVPAYVLASAPFFSAAFNVVFWRLYGQTPGKWLMGIRVVSLGGGRVTVAHALVRFIGYLASALPFYAGFLWMLGPSRRGWHDHLARTEVVYTGRRRPIVEEFQGITAPARA